MEQALDTPTGQRSRGPEERQVPWAEPGVPLPSPRRPQSSPQVASGLLSWGKACPQNVLPTPLSDGLALSAYRSPREPALPTARGNLSPTSSATELTPGSQHQDKVILREDRT